MIKKYISPGDIIWMENFEELIEVKVCIPRKTRPKIQYWNCKAYEGTNQCREADAWIIFKYGVKVGSTE